MAGIANNAMKNQISKNNEQRLHESTQIAARLKPASGETAIITNSDWLKPRL